MPEDLTHTAGPGKAAVVETSAPPASPPSYELREEIGRGGMGVVYRARDPAFDRDVAVKLLADRYPADSPAAERFLSEARITGQLQHPGIPAVHQVGTLADGRPFLAMKLIKGSTLEAILKQRADPAADRGRLLAIFEAVCQAVGYAHAHHVIHRDLKPANVMVGAFGEVQVMDWGLAKVLGEDTPATADSVEAAQTRAWTQFSPTPEAGSHTQAGSVVGTPAFIPPEQAIGEIERVNKRSDVFGLGALLAVVLTGKPPYVGETVESVRVQAVRGKLQECFARLDVSGAEPALVALCKECLAFEPVERPTDAGAVAQAVAAFREAANERARRAELERVRVEGEQATAEARAAERRKRRRLAIAAVALLAVAVVVGLTAVLVVQQRANAELAEEQAKVQARFELAQKAIATFHTGVSEDALLKNEQFKELRTKLLKEAAGFYGDLEKLLQGQTDAKSRQLLAAGYFQLGELTAKIGSRAEALAVHRKALAVRRDLAGATGADVETRLDVARGLWAVGDLLLDTGDRVGALRAYEEQRDITTALEAESPTDAVRAVLAGSHANIGVLLWRTGKLAEALEAQGKALAIRQKLADANPAVAHFQTDLAGSHNNIAIVLSQTGKPEEALVQYRQALAIREKLADANTGVAHFQYDLARIHFNIGYLLWETGKSEEALAAHDKALAIRQKLADANPAVIQFQSDLADCYYNIGIQLYDTGKLGEALATHEKARAIRQKLADATLTVTWFQSDLASSHVYIGCVLDRMGMAAEALAEFDKARVIQQKLADANPAVTEFPWRLAYTNNNMGEMLAQTGKPGEALAAYEKARAIRQKLADAHPTTTSHLTDLGYSHAYRGWAHVRAGQPAAAAADLRRAVELWAKDKAPSIDARFEKFRALALLAGLGADAKSGVTSIEAACFTDRAMAALCDAIQAGWAKRGELQEPDFDLLRKRDDFQKLQKEVEAKAASRASLNKQPEPDKN
jgi:eukaryotic-like serine/threonine-protein kinase